MGIIKAYNSEDALILTIDGFIDNEWGFVKFKGNTKGIGTTLPPYGFCITRLDEIADGWHYFFST